MYIYINANATKDEIATLRLQGYYPQFEIIEYETKNGENLIIVDEPQSK
jgi:hypothetical protein